MSLLLTIEKYLAAGLLKLFDATWRKEVINDTYKEPCIYMFWHRNQIPMTVVNAKKNAGVLISSSKDGELIAGPVSVLGYKPIRGSSTRGGSSALRKMLDYLKTGPVAITPDGPKGPLYKIKKGSILLATKSGRPIIPVAVDVKGEWLFNSWDKFRFPKPFAKIRIHFGEPYYCDNSKTIESMTHELESITQKMTENIEFVRA